MNIPASIPLISILEKEVLVFSIPTFVDFAVISAGARVSFTEIRAFHI
jgi:hypothetical protein